MRISIASVRAIAKKTGQKLPAEPSIAEEEFFRQFTVDHQKNHTPLPKREHVFHATRKWRFDFAWPNRKIAVEIEGITAEGGRHQRREGFEADCEKYNAAMLDGWMVLRFTPRMVRRLVAFETTLKAMSEW